MNGRHHMPDNKKKPGSPENPNTCESHQQAEQIDCLPIKVLSREYEAISHKMDELRLNLSLALPHELRTPLNAILGLSEYLISLEPEKLPSSPEELERVYAGIHQNALRLHHLTENYLLYAKLRVFQDVPEKLICDKWRSERAIQTGEHIVHHALRAAEQAHRQADLCLEVTDSSARISQHSLQKIVEELLDNAFKFSSPGTPVCLRTKTTEQAWMLSVIDQGHGMTPQQITDIGAYMQFERDRYAQQGSGLGLAIVYLLTRLQRGTLHIDSTFHQGTTVSVEFNYL